MEREELILRAVRKEVESLPQRYIGEAALTYILSDGDLTIEGAVSSVAAKKLVLERAAALPGVGGIVDRLHVRPAQQMSDPQIRDAVRNALIEEPALAGCGIYVADQPVRVPPAIDGKISLSVSDGIVTLDGEVCGLGRKRLAGLLAWWVPGSRDVINGLGVIPDETDSDDEITDAVRIALEKDPFVNAAQIRVSTRASVVTLCGLVPTESERDTAAADAWYIFGVDKVTNEIEVQP